MQPASIDTAKPFVVLRMTLPVAITLGSNTVTSQVVIAASVLVHGTTKYSCAQGVSSSPNSTAWMRDEEDEEAEHRDGPGSGEKREANGNPGEARGGVP